MSLSISRDDYCGWGAGVVNGKSHPEVSSGILWAAGKEEVG